MEDFLRLAREVSAHNSTLLDYEASSSCLDSYDSSALLDDRDCGTIFPTGENLPSVTPTINRTDRFTEIEADEIKSVMDDSITLANLPHESDLVPQVSLAINDEECCALHLSESMQLHSVSPVHTLASSGQLKCDAFYPLLSAPSGGSASAVQRADSAITPHLHVKPSLFHRKSYSLINDEFNNLPNFGNSEIPMLAEIHPTLPQSNHLCSPDLIAQLKQEDTSFCLPELGSFTENNVCVSIVPPPADKKKTSSCKVVGDKVYVKNNESFWLKFHGSYEALTNTEICLETSYLEPDYRDTPVLACHRHWQKHIGTCKKEHQVQESFLCTGGLVPVENKCDDYGSYTPLRNIAKNKLEPVGSGMYEFNLKTTALCWNSCNQHKDNGKNILMIVSLRSETHGMRRSLNSRHEFKVTCCESPTRDSKPSGCKRRRISSSSTINLPINIPMNSSCLLSPRSQSSSPASYSPDESSASGKNFTLMTPMLSQEAAQQVHNLIATKMGLSCHIMEHRTNF